MAVGQLLERQDRPAYVRFERVAVEDKQESIRQARFVAKDVDYALITPPYSKDVVRIKVTQWITNMDQDVRNERLPASWRDEYLEAYKRWQNGQEMPLHGTPIKGWGVLSPAQQEMLTRINILTVEDLAGVNHEGLQRIGMGSMDLKNKAIAWLAQLQDKGPLTQEVAALKRDNASLLSQVETLSKQVESLLSKVNVQKLDPPDQSHLISADDILPEVEPTKPKRK